MTTTTITPRRVGRPEKTVAWPSGDFTINDLKDLGMSRVSLQLKVQKAVNKHELHVVGNDKGVKRMGRPSTIYRAVSPAQVPA